MRWGRMSAGGQAASADGAGVVSARLPERLVSRSKIARGLDGIGRDWTGLDGIGRDWTGLDGIGRDWTGLERNSLAGGSAGRCRQVWSATHSPVAALGGVVRYHPHRSETKALHTCGTPSSARFGRFARTAETRVAAPNRLGQRIRADRIRADRIRADDRGGRREGPGNAPDRRRERRHRGPVMRLVRLVRCTPLPLAPWKR